MIDNLPNGRYAIAKSDTETYGVSIIVSRLSSFAYLFPA